MPSVNCQSGGVAADAGAAGAGTGVADVGAAELTDGVNCAGAGVSFGAWYGGIVCGSA